MVDQELSFGDGVPEEELRSGFTSLPLSFSSLPELDFRIAVPTNWTRHDPESVRQPEFEEFVELITLAHGPDTGLQVLATQLPFEVNLVDWLEFIAHQRGFSLETVQSGDTASGQMVHAAGTGPKGEHLRLMVTGSGEFLLFVMGFAPSPVSPETREILGLMAASVDLLHPGRRTREELKTYRDRDRVFSMVYPQSWSSEVLPRYRPKKIAVDFRLQSETDTLAYLRVEAVRGLAFDEASLDRLIQDAKDELVEANIRLSGLKPIPASGMAGPRQRWLGTAHLPAGDGVVAMLFRPDGRTWLSAILIAPDKERSPYVWMRGKRMYEYAVASLKEMD